MATINLGAIKFNWRGSYSGATAYVVDDVVESSGSSYICIAATTGNAPPNATYWELMSQAGTDGTDGTDLTTTLTTQGDIVYRDGSGLARLGAGTSGQALVTQGTGANPIWSNVGADFSPMFYAYRSTAFAFNASTQTKVIFNAELYDTDNAFSTTTGLFTVPSGKGGKYFIFAGTRKSFFSGSRFFMQLRKNGSTDILTMENSYAGDSYVGVNGATVLEFSAGDTIQADVYHTDSGSRELLGSPDNTYLGGYKLTD